MKDLALHFIRRIRGEPAWPGADPAERDRQIASLRAALAEETQKDNPKGDG